MHYDGISLAFNLCHGSIRAYTLVQDYWSIDISAIVVNSQKFPEITLRAKGLTEQIAYSKNDGNRFPKIVPPNCHSNK